MALTGSLTDTGFAQEMQGAPVAERLACWEACAERNPWLGHMEAARLLAEQERMAEAFAHLERQVAVDPLRGYGAYAELLFRRLQRLQPTGKVSIGCWVFGLANVTLFYVLQRL